MVKNFLRSTAAILASLVLAIALLAAIELLGQLIYPFPADFPGTREAMMDYVANYPAWVLAMLPYPMWFWILVLIALPKGIFYGVTIGRMPPD